jgi:uncharacterized protein (DUF3820 family)
MAHNLNWEKIKQRPQPRDYSNDYANQYDYNKVVTSWQNTSWPIKGKYHGTKLKDLPLSYLEWVGMNFNTNSKGYKLVVQELECRTNRT